jgi:hypothetical protein
MNEQIVWQSTLDDRFEVQVVRVAPYQGKLLIREAGEEIYSHTVPPTPDHTNEWRHNGTILISRDSL